MFESMFGKRSGVLSIGIEKEEPKKESDAKSDETMQELAGNYLLRAFESHDPKVMYRAFKICMDVYNDQCEEEMEEGEMY